MSWIDIRSFAIDDLVPHALVSPLETAGCQNFRSRARHWIVSLIEAHIFIAFLAYILHVTLGRHFHAMAPGLTARSAIEKLSAIQMIDGNVPTIDGRSLMLSRYTKPEKETQILINKLNLCLPLQPLPKITSSGAMNVGSLKSPV